MQKSLYEEKKEEGNLGFQIQKQVSELKIPGFSVRQYYSNNRKSFIDKNRKKVIHSRN